MVAYASYILLVHISMSSITHSSVRERSVSPGIKVTTWEECAVRLYIPSRNVVIQEADRCLGLTQVHINYVTH